MLLKGLVKSFSIMLQTNKQFFGLQFSERSTRKDQRPFTSILLLDESSEALAAGIVKESRESTVS